MSSEMRKISEAWKLSAKQFSELGSDIGMIEAAVYSNCAKEIDALLARTEAGADGAFVAWAAVSPRGTILALYGDKAQAERDVRRFGDIPDAVIRPLVWGDAHPQDASGDAERALEWLGGEMRTSTVYMNGSRAFSPSSFAMRKHDLRGRTFLEAVLNAMQAKEAK